MKKNATPPQEKTNASNYYGYLGKYKSYHLDRAQHTITRHKIKFGADLEKPSPTDPWKKVEADAANREYSLLRH